MNDTLGTVAGRPQVRLERRLAHPPEKVWRAITDADHLGRWYPARAEPFEPAVGERIRFDYGGDVRSEAVIIEAEPARVFAFVERAPEQMVRETEARIRFDLSADGAGCLLVFTHTFDDRPAAASYATGWHACLRVLADSLDGRPAEHGAVSVEVYERYVEEFGLDEGTVRTTAEGWQVRFDRQLRYQSTDAVWAALTNGGSPAVGAPVPPAVVVAGLAVGPVLEVSAPTSLDYGWLRDGADAGRVRWELSGGPGGARITVTQTGPAGADDERAAALTGWRDHLRDLVRRLRATD